MKSLTESLIESGKSLSDFIKRHKINEANDECKSFTFTFKDDFDDKDNTLNKLADFAETENIKYDKGENSLTLTITKDVTDSSELLNTLKEYASMLRKSNTNSSDETFATATRKFKETIDSIFDYLKPEEEEKPDDKEKKEEE